MVGVLGPASRPAEVTEHQFDGFAEELAELSQMDWDKIPDEYFWYYFHDLAYVELQPDLFRYLFPACLKFWYDTLMRGCAAERGDSDFHYAMMRGDIANKMLNKNERSLLHDFFHDGFLDRLESQRGLIYDVSKSENVSSGTAANAWIRRFNALAIIAPIIERIWDSWWVLDHPGKAYCAIMYGSGLVYLKGENPIYHPWTPERGGGGPYLTESEGSLFDWTWHDDNLDFLKTVLTPNYLAEKLDQAAKTVSNSEYAQTARKVARDANSNSDIVQLRIDDLLENLAMVPLAQAHWDA